MSKAEIERFNADVAKDAGLRQELSEIDQSVAAVVEFAKDKGYDITVEEVHQYIQEQVAKEKEKDDSDLSDDELDAIAGGYTYTTAAVATYAAAAAHIAVGTEVAVNVAEAVEVATSGVVAAEAVAVVVMT